MSASTSPSDPRYPVGKFTAPPKIDDAARREMIQQIADVPARLKAAIAGLSDAQLDTPYRDGGWTLRQVIHHMADSHMNAFIRTKFALTQQNPTIMAYDENAWAQTPEYKLPIGAPVQLLDGLHQRFATLLRGLSGDQWKRTLQHPERGPMTLDDQLALYAWHGRHHVAHITAARQRNGW